MNWIRGILGRAAGWVVRRYIAPHLPASKDTVIDRAARFAACEMVDGDYLEFGVYRGASFVAAYHAIERHFRARIAQRAGGEREAEAADRRREILDGMRFVAFDSFQGLPDLGEADDASLDFQPGQYAASESEFREAVAGAGVPEERVIVVPGWFEETCTAETRRTHGIRRAAIVWIDADLYTSTCTALDFITPLLQDGTVIVFDDWFSYRGSPYAGEQRAFREWLDRISPEWTAQEHARESWKRVSFIVSRVPHPNPPGS